MEQATTYRSQCNDIVTLYNSGGNIYTGNIPSSGTNTTSMASTYTATVTAADSTLSSTVSATGQVIQANDNAPPTINASIGPATLPAAGGPITVTATINDPQQRPITSSECPSERVA